MEHTRAFVWTSWGLRLIVAVILLQTLFFKFTGARESVYIFSTLGMEPWGRIGSGVFELIASALLLIPSTVPFGAAMALAATGSAIVFHLTRLGVALAAVGDRGELFALAVLVVLCSAALLLMYRRELPFVASHKLT
ncbi:MAG: DoxX family protein [Bryobacteraceae bacterium]